jgi:serine O-acetyltransferase
MISSKEELSFYLAKDLNRYEIKKWRFGMSIRHPTTHFVRVLRRVEYYHNCRSDPVGRLISTILKLYFRIISIYLGFTIPPNTCGPGLALNHWGTIVISPNARIGCNARINVCVNIGLKDGAAPVIGDHVYIGPGAKLFGGIRIGDHVKIGANAVVNKSFPDNVTLAGVPAVIVEHADKERSPSVQTVSAL